jgi:hypothetical protein
MKPGERPETFDKRGKLVLDSTQGVMKAWLDAARYGESAGTGAVGIHGSFPPPSPYFDV